jgi:hypothetical protein
VISDSVNQRFEDENGKVTDENKMINKTTESRLKIMQKMKLMEITIQNMKVCIYVTEELFKDQPDLMIMSS